MLKTQISIFSVMYNLGVDLNQAVVGFGLRNEYQPGQTDKP